MSRVGGGEKAQGMVVRSGTPSVLLHRITQIKTYEVMDTDLSALNEAMGQESQALGFFTFCGGCLVSCAVAWVNPPAGVLGIGILAAMTAVFALAVAFFFVSWLRHRKKRPEIIQRIRDSTRFEFTEPVARVQAVEPG